MSEHSKCVCTIETHDSQAEFFLSPLLTISICVDKRVAQHQRSKFLTYSFIIHGISDTNKITAIIYLP